MENNIPVMAKKLWSMVRVILYMVRKGICKRKLLLDLNLMMKRGKIAGKALGNLMFHHHNNHPNNHSISIDKHQKEYEFSCSNTPFHAHFTRPFHLTKRSKKNKYNGGVGNKHYIEDVDDLEGVSHVLEMMLNGNYYDNNNNNNNVGVMPSSSPSPFLPGLSFGKSPMVRQLRITDSPYPLQNMEEEDSRVDEAAEAFIKRFYSQLQRQKSTSSGAPSTPN